MDEYLIECNRIIELRKSRQQTDVEHCESAIKHAEIMMKYHATEIAMWKLSDYKYKNNEIYFCNEHIKYWNGIRKDMLQIKAEILNLP